MKKIIDWFFKPATPKFKFVGFTVVSLIFLIWFLLFMNACASFEKTTGYKQNEVWSQ
jgi:hypothetical protein